MRREYTIGNMSILLLKNYLVIMDSNTGEIIGEWTYYLDQWVNAYLSDNHHLYKFS